MIRLPGPDLPSGPSCPTCGGPWSVLAPASAAVGAPRAGAPRAAPGPARDGAGSVPGERAAVLGLHLPADPVHPVTLVTVKLSAVAISEQLGGGLLDDSACGVVGGHRFTLYLDDERLAKALPVNVRAVALATRLGYGDVRWRSELRGDALALGRTPFDDTDVPTGVLHAAGDAGLLP